MRATVLQSWDATDDLKRLTTRGRRLDGPDLLAGSNLGNSPDAFLDAPLDAHHLSAVVRVPALPRHLVHRQRLIDVLDEDVPLTTAIAPAGSGKTTLFAEWAGRVGRPVAWLNPIAGAGGPVAFWAAMADSLESLSAIGPAVKRDLARRRLPIGDVVLWLLNELRDASPTPGAIVLDDFHEVEDDVIDASLNLFLRHLPDHLRILIASRREPGLPIERLRAGGVLAEVRFSELRFSPEESFEFLHALVDGEPVEDVRAAAAEANGWAAALRLSATQMRLRRSRPAGSESSEMHQLMGDYIRHEVFSSEADEVALFLHDLAVVDRFTVDLAVAITERPDAAELIERAEAHGLMVSRAGVYGWYEIHSVVRSVLLSDLRDAERTRVARRRAATWLEGAGETLAALEQWLLAGEHGEVLRLLALHHIELYDAGRDNDIRDLLAHLAPGTTTDLSALLDLGWCQLLTSRAAFLDCVDQADWWASNRGISDGPLTSKLDTMKSISCLIRGDWSMASELARRRVSPLDLWPDDPVGRTGWSNVGRAIALSERWDDSLDELRELAVTARREPSRRVEMEATRALGEALAGRPGRRAADRSRPSVVALARQPRHLSS